MSADALLSRLDKVRSRGPSKWAASCPLHKDRTPSLSISETTEGNVLVWCFSCGAKGPAVIEALGLDIGELFPDGGQPSKGNRPRWNYRELLNACYGELLFVATAARDMRKGRHPTQADLKRLDAACGRLAGILTAIE